MLSSRSSSLGSLQNLFSSNKRSSREPRATGDPVRSPFRDPDVEDEILVSGPDQNRIPTPNGNPDFEVEYQDSVGAFDSDDDNGTAEVRYTRNHPLGRMFLALATDSTRQAKKTKLTAMESNIDEFCRDFCNYMRTSNARMNSAINCAISNAETNWVNKEFNTYRYNMSVEPPPAKYFSPKPVIANTQQRNEILRTFPTRHKFTGVPKDGSMDVVEFLRLVRTAQMQARLSEDEFKDMLLASTTGKPHALLVAWMSHDDDIPTLFHNLMIHFDRSMSPETAKQQLHEYRAPKGATLAKVEAHIMLLADRASVMLPLGPARDTYYNMERVQSLIKCLPPHSSGLVQSKYNDLSAKINRAATASQLSNALNGLRHVIDKDIQEHGVDRKFKPTIKSTRYSNTANSDDKIMRTRRLTAYSVSQSQTNSSSSSNSAYRHRPQPSYNSSSQNTFRTLGHQRGRNIHTHRHGHQGSANFQPLGRRDQSDRFLPRQGGFGRPQNTRHHQGHYCSLCGKKDHVSAQDCPHMVTDQGKIIKIMPTLGTCNACPARITPRLNHPSSLCPYRKGGPLERSN